MIYSLFMSTIIYPIPVHWIWGANGWAYKKGTVDFAGTIAVHFVGGFSALIALLWVGPRKGRYVDHDSLNNNKILIEKKEREIEKEFAPHNTGYILMGTLLLWFGWYGFNCGSTLSATDDYAK